MIKITSMFDAFLRIGGRGDFSKGEMKILFYLMGMCGYRNNCSTSLRDICRDTGEQKGNARLYLDSLAKRGMVKIAKGPRKGNRPTDLQVSIEYADFKSRLDDSEELKSGLTFEKLDEMMAAALSDTEENLSGGSIYEQLTKLRESNHRHKN